jgi:hypothetical protein
MQRPVISVVAAVRGRIDLLSTMLESLRATAEHPDRVEVILRCDFDDTAMVAYLGGLARHRFIVGPRLSGYAALPAFANEAARLSTGDLILVVNDDAEFVTWGWDTKLVEAAAAYPDGLFVFGVETANAQNFVFPCVSRRFIDTMGEVFDERMVYADIWLRDVLYPFGRAIRLSDVVIAHHWEGQSADQQHAVRDFATASYQALYAQCVADGRAKIQAALA